MAYEIEVCNARANGTTGHVDVDVRAVEGDGNSTHYGPVRTYGIDATALKTQYNGDVQSWLQWVKREHQAHHGLHASMMATLHSLKGTRL